MLMTVPERVEKSSPVVDDSIPSFLGFDDT